MKRRPKIKQYKQPTYGVNLVSIQNCSLDVFCKTLLKKYNVEYNRKTDFNLAGVTAAVDELNTIFIWVEKQNDFATFAHEALHAVNMIFNSRGVKLDISWDDEIQAYLIGELVERLF